MLTVAMPSDRHAAACHALSAVEAVAYAALTLAEPLRISRWVEIMGLLGHRESPARAFSTTTFRPVIGRLAERGLMLQAKDDSFWLLPGSLPLALRWLSRREDAARIAAMSGPPHLDDVDAVRRGLATRRADVDLVFDRLLSTQPSRAASLALDLTLPYDRAWLSSVSPAFHERLVETALVALEHGPSASIGPYPHLTAHAEERAHLTPRALAALAGTAVQRGALELVRGLVASSPNDVRSHLVTALALIDGHTREAAALARVLPPPRRGDHAGTLFLLATFALWLDAPGSDAFARRVDFGGRKNAPLQQTFRLFAAMASESALAPVRWASGVPMDRLTPLWHALYARDRPEHWVQARAVEGARASAAVVGAAGFQWLQTQAAHAAWELHQRLPDAARRLVDTSPEQPPGPLPLVLVTASTARAPWEIQLERLASAADAFATPATAPRPSTVDRIVWRSFHGSLEAYVQKRGAAGKWTGGRKLALKHLLPDGSALASLPEEDRRVARHVREQRHISYGYPVVDHHVDRRAWLDLVGHPRVHVAHDDEPTPVVRGALHLTMTTEEGASVLRAEPPDLVSGVNVHELEDQIVVYDVDDATAKLLETLRTPLRVPPEGAPRLVSIVEQLATRLPVASSTRTRARGIEPDPRPTMRLSPSRGGLVVTLLARPLGTTGPLVSPGAGAPTLLGQMAGEPVQTTRDLEAEVARAGEVTAGCPMLEGLETGDHEWFVEEPETCLELVAALDRLGDRVRVEWPHGASLRVRARIGRPALRGKLAREGGAFTLEAALHVDGELSLDLEQLFDLLATHPGRFVQLASGDYVELEQDLRELLDGLRAARAAQPDVARSEPGRVAVPAAAVSVLDALTAPGGALALDAVSTTWRQRFEDVFRKVPRVPRTFQGELRDYQVEGFRWLARLADLGLGACLADDMGLGKTVQIACLLLHRASAGAALVVAPTSVCEGWRRELARFAPTLAVRMVLTGADREGALRDLGRRDVVVTSYAILQQEAAAFQAVTWTTAVLDEAQLIKNAETRRAQAAFGLRAEARVVATGTPVENHAGDLFSLFHLLNPGLLGTARSFAAAMADGAAGARARRRLLQPFVLRRTKAQVLDDLPPLTEVQRTITFTPGEARLYESIRKAALSKLKSGGASGKARVAVLAELTRLRRLCCHPGLVSPEAGLTSSKLESLLELLEELVEANHRVLVFSQFTDVLALVKPLLDAKRITYQHLDGSTPPKQRATAVDAFQSGEGDVFLISLKAGGFGLNLTGADYVVHVDPWWNPAVESQASDRAHRIGQTRPVTVYRLVAAGTIEERIVALHREKRELADEILEGSDRASALTADDLRDLLEA